MTTKITSGNSSPENSLQKVAVNRTDQDMGDIFSELERGVYAALETYSNVHRGSGHNSMVTTHLYDQARGIVLEYLRLNKNLYTVIFFTPGRSAVFLKQLEPESYRIVSSHQIGLSIGIVALALQKKALPGGTPSETGGGTTKLISKNWVIWADVPDKFEAGTPAIINVIAFARALLLIQQYRKDIFLNQASKKLSASEILYYDALEKFSGHELLQKLRQTLIGRNNRVPTTEGLRPFINLDNSASTRTFEPVWNAFRYALRQPQHIKQEVIEEVRHICAAVLGAPLSTYDVIFTSNTTEAINLTAESLSRDNEENVEPVVLNTLLEHSSNDLPWRMIHQSSVIRLSVNAEGFVDFSELETLLITYNQKGSYGKKRIKLLSVSGASNVLGICNDLPEISRIAHQYGARLLVDAAQLVAHREVAMDKCGIDYLAFSAHKMYAPFGCGVLVAKKGLLNFNTAELHHIQTSGEENAGGIAALGKALVLLQRIGMDIIREEEQVLTRLALHSLSKIPSLRIYGVKDPDSPGFAHKVGVIVFDMKGVMPNRVAKELALRGGIGVRYGCHCAHILIKHLLQISPFLEGFQRLIQTLFPKFRFLGLVRISLGIENSEKDIAELINVLGKIAKKPVISTDSHTVSTLDGTPGLSQAVVQQQMNDFTKTVAQRVYSLR